MDLEPSRAVVSLQESERLDRLVDPIHDAVDAVLPQGPVRDVLHGTWLGHPLHPLLTDLPIGFWTSAWVLDLVGGEERASAAQTLVGLGVLSALPTAASGAADWSALFRSDQRTGVVHGLANAGATVLYGASWLARRAGNRRGGIALGLVGAAAATVGGYLGGHLAFRRAAGVDHGVIADGPGDWTEADEPLDLDGLGPAPLVAHVGGDAVLVTLDPDDVTIHAIDARCVHLGGPLEDGEVIDGCVRCPWHGSTFRLDDGSVVHGPATAPQPCYEARISQDRLELRRA